MAAFTRDATQIRPIEKSEHANFEAMTHFKLQPTKS